MSLCSSGGALLSGILACLFVSVCSAGVSYNGFKHYKLTPLSSEAVQKIQWLYAQYPSEPDINTGLTFLSLPGQRRFESVDLLVPPGIEAPFLTAARETPALKVRLLHRNYGRLLVQFLEQNKLARDGDIRGRVRRDIDGSSGPRLPQQQQWRDDQANGMLLRHNYYRSYREIRLALLQLNEKCNQIRPTACQLLSIGTTFEGRDLIVLSISKPSPRAGSKTKIWIDGGIHAREWVSPATVLYIADKLISELASSGGDSAAEIINNHEILIIPMLNPDGYEFSRLRNRLWRKNRQPTHDRNCLGVDLNRNYGYKWGGPGSSSVPCRSTYRGSRAFSSAEITAVKNFLEPRNSSMLMFLSFHSYGQFILLPFGHSPFTYSSTHNRKMRCAAYKAVYSMLNVNGRFYTYGAVSDIMYSAAGGSDDWAHGSAGIPYSFTIELPDEGDFGFLLPAAQVPGIGREVMAGLWALVDTARRLEAGDTATTEECAASYIT